MPNKVVLDALRYSDVILGDREVIVRGDTLKTSARDLVLDNPNRRVDKNPDKQRRALVHSQVDGLTINYDQDYPGGVTIRAVDMIEGNPRNAEHANSIEVKARVLNCQGTDIILDCKDRRIKDENGKPASGQRRALVHDENDNLAINYGSDYTGGVKIDGPVFMPKGRLVIGGVSFNCKKDGDAMQISLPEGMLDIGGIRFHCRRNGNTMQIISKYCTLNGIFNLPEGEIRLSNVTLKPSVNNKRELTADGGIRFVTHSDASRHITVNSNEIIAGFYEQTGPHNMEFREMELIKTIKSLQYTVTRLEERVKELESNIIGKEIHVDTEA
jgi:hypothetical protein